MPKDESTKILTLEIFRLCGTALLFSGRNILCITVLKYLNAGIFLRYGIRDH